MLQLQIFRHENNSEIKNEQKQVQKFNTSTGIYRPTKMFRCSDLGSDPGTQH